MPLGFTLVELVVVMAIITILAALAVPSLSGLTRTSSEGATRTAFRSLFASVRVRAATTQRYAAIRFQQGKDGRYYAIMLEQVQPSSDFPNGCPAYEPDCVFLTFTAVDNTEPVALPRGVELTQGDLDPSANPDNEFVPDFRGVIPATTFTVVFSPSGQIVRRLVHVSQRRDNWKRIGSDPWVKVGCDHVFNLTWNKPDGKGLCPPDVKDVNPLADPADETDPDPQTEVGPNQGTRNSSDEVLPPEISQNSVWVCEQQKRIDAGATPFTGYIQQSGTLIPLNVYTGAPVNTRQ